MTESAPHTTNPFFSIAVPAYNAGKTIAAAIASVETQTDGDWELIVVDDGSTDDTREQAERAARGDVRVRVISQPNAGCGAARNTAIGHAWGSWIVRFDADDLLLPAFLSRIRAAIENHPEVEIVSPSGLRRYPDGHETLWCPEARYSKPFLFSFHDALHGWCPVFTHSAFRRSLWERVGGIRPDIYAEDYDFWARALATGAKGWYFPEPLSVYASGERDQMSASGNRIAMSYLDTLEHIADAHTLKPDDQAAVEVRVAQLHRRVAFRMMTSKLLGERGSERLSNALIGIVNWLRGLRE